MHSNPDSATAMSRSVPFGTTRLREPDEEVRLQLAEYSRLQEISGFGALRRTKSVEACFRVIGNFLIFRNILILAPQLIPRISSVPRRCGPWPGRDFLYNLHLSNCKIAVCPVRRIIKYPTFSFVVFSTCWNLDADILQFADASISSDLDGCVVDGLLCLLPIYCDHIPDRSGSIRLSSEADPLYGTLLLRYFDCLHDR